MNLLVFLFAAVFTVAIALSLVSKMFGLLILLILAFAAIVAVLNEAER